MPYPLNAWEKNFFVHFTVAITLKRVIICPSTLLRFKHKRYRTKGTVEMGSKLSNFY